MPDPVIADDMDPKVNGLGLEAADVASDPKDGMPDAPDVDPKVKGLALEVGVVPVDPAALVFAAPVDELPKPPPDCNDDAAAPHVKGLEPELLGAPKPNALFDVAKAARLPNPSDLVCPVPKAEPNAKGAGAFAVSSLHGISFPSTTSPQLTISTDCSGRCFGVVFS